MGRCAADEAVSATTAKSVTAANARAIELFIEILRAGDAVYRQPRWSLRSAVSGSAARPRRVSFRRDERVLELIGDHTVLDRTPPQARLQQVAGLLEDAARRRVVRERDGEQPRQTVRLDRVLGHGDERVGDDPASPERLAQPVADFRGRAIDVLVEHESDATDGVAVDRDREGRLGIGFLHRAKKADAVGPSIRMRKAIAKIDPDLPVVRVADQRVEVGGLPRTDLAALEREAHVRASLHYTTYRSPPDVCAAKRSSENERRSIRGSRPAIRSARMR